MSKTAERMDEFLEGKVLVDHSVLQCVLHFLKYVFQSNFLQFVYL